MSDGFILKKDTGRDAMIERIGQFIELLPQDRAWEVTVTPYKKTRSDVQNNALWGLAYKLLSEHTGHEDKELHEYFLGEHFGWEVKEMFGQKKKQPKHRSSKLKTHEFADFFSFVQRFAASELGVYIPDPDPMYAVKRERARKAA